MKSYFEGKRVLVTGGAGTVGREMVRQLAALGAREVRVVDNNETETFFLMGEYGRSGDVTVNAVVGDIRDVDRLVRLMEGIDIVFHAAALKHVVVCEHSPYDAVQTNIVGTQNVITAALANDVERVIYTSSDKAVNSTNVMGTSKLMGERLFTAANNMRATRRTVFSSTRFGNVIGSRGSVAPLFARQILAGGPVTLTDRRMTRFIMTIEESVELVLKAATIAQGGEVFVTKMPVMRISDLAEAMIRTLAPRAPDGGLPPEAISIEEIGAKPGEKLYEELMSEEEVGRAIELEDLFVVLPTFDSGDPEKRRQYDRTVNATVTDPYVSASKEAMDIEAIIDYLKRHQVLESFLSRKGTA